MNNNLILKTNNTHKYEFVYNEVISSSQKVVRLPRNTQWHGTIKEIMRDLNMKSILHKRKKAY